MKPQCMTIQMKAAERYFHLVLFIMLGGVVRLNIFSSFAAHMIIGEVPAKQSTFLV